MIALLLAVLAGAGEAPETPRQMTPPIAVDNAFISTHLRFRQGAGLLWIPNYKMPGWPGRVDLALAGAIESLEVQGALSHRTAIYGRLGGQVITGLNLDSVFLHGARSSGFLELGGRTVLSSASTHLVTGRVLLSGHRGAGLTPEPLASAFAKERWETLSAVLDGQTLDYVLGQRRGTTGGLGLSTAVPLPRPFGLMASATLLVGQVTYSSPTQRPDRTSRTLATAGIGFDWRPDGRVPLGLLLELHDRQEQEGWLAGELRATSENRALVAMTLAYTGREELHLGLTAAVLSPTANPGSEQVYSLEVAFRYEF